MFQSRNRESSYFNLSVARLWGGVSTAAGFNLVIENLLISTKHTLYLPLLFELFQSRNRESSYFNRIRCVLVGSEQLRFQSRNRESSYFNFSVRVYADENIVGFQSRNRESSYFNFQGRVPLDATITSKFQSRNRESSYFNMCASTDGTASHCVSIS